jgi:hypothetical protein
MHRPRYRSATAFASAAVWPKHRNAFPSPGRGGSTASATNMAAHRWGRLKCAADLLARRVRFIDDSVSSQRTRDFVFQLCRYRATDGVLLDGPKEESFASAPVLPEAADVAFFLLARLGF